MALENVPFPDVVQVTPVAEPLIVAASVVLLVVVHTEKSGVTDTVGSVFTVMVI